MNRIPLISLVLIGVFTEVSGQDLELTNIALFPLAYDPIEIQDSGGRLLEEPTIEEYVVLRELDLSEGTPPRSMDIVGIIANTDEAEAWNAVVALQRSRRVTSFEDAGRSPPVGDWASWEIVEEKIVDPIPPHSHVKVVFEAVSIEALWSDLWSAGQWPSEVRFRIVMRCGTCSPTVGPAMSTIELKPKD